MSARTHLALNPRRQWDPSPYAGTDRRLADYVTDKYAQSLRHCHPGPGELLRFRTNRWWSRLLIQVNGNSYFSSLFLPDLRTNDWLAFNSSDLIPAGFIPACCIRSMRCHENQKKVRE